MIKCPGCNENHVLDERWTFVNAPDLERPTFLPSLLVRWQFGNDRAPKVCHSFITNGQIQFLGDCTHALAGQTVDLPELAR